MKISRRTLRHKLEQQGQAPVPEPRDSFVNSLEQRLRSLDLSVPSASSNVRPLRRGLSRGAAIGVAAALASGAGAAAVAIVASRTDDAPSVVNDTSPEPTATTIPVASSTTAPPPTIELTTVPATVASPTTVAVTTIPVTTVPVEVTAPAPTTQVATTVPPPPTELPTTTAPPTTVAEVIVPPTSPPETAPPEAPTTSSTEVHKPATLGLDCTMDGVSVTCTWTPGPDGTDHYAVLRSTPGEAQGRAFFPEPGATTYVDTGVVPGTTYTYLVHALDPANSSLAHTPPVTVTCCG